MTDYEIGTGVASGGGDVEFVAELFGVMDAVVAQTTIQQYTTTAGDFETNDIILIKVHHAGTGSPQSQIRVTANGVNLDWSSLMTSSSGVAIAYVMQTPKVSATDEGTAIVQGVQGSNVQISKISTADFNVSNWLTTSFDIALRGLNATGISSHHALIYRIKGGGTMGVFA